MKLKTRSSEKRFIQATVRMNYFKYICISKENESQKNVHHNPKHMM